MNRKEASELFTPLFNQGVRLGIIDPGTIFSQQFKHTMQDFPISDKDDVFSGALLTVLEHLRRTDQKASLSEIRELALLVVVILKQMALDRSGESKGKNKQTEGEEA